MEFEKKAKIMGFQNICMEKSWKKFEPHVHYPTKFFALRTRHPMMMMMKFTLFVLILVQKVWLKGVMWSPLLLITIPFCHGHHGKT